MSAILYDEALINKLKSWTGDSELHIVNSSDVNTLIAIKADENNDGALRLPFVAVTRSGYTISTPTRTDLSAWGLNIEANMENVEWLNAIPIKLEYQIDVYTRYQEEAEEIMRNMIFNAVNFPRVTVELPYYDLKLIHNSTLSLSEQIADNSSISERLIQGQFTRLTMNMAINDAYLFDLRIGKAKYINADVILENEYYRQKYRGIKRGE